MKRASQIFSDEERRLIEDAIEKAELGTSGEIIPVVATASGRYDRGEDLFGLVTALLAVAVAWGLCQGVKVEGNAWAQYTIGLGLLPVLLIFAAAFLLGAVAATYFPALRLPFISKGEMEEEVERAAMAAFHRFNLGRTADATGILIYVSLYEHMVRVLGDDTINAKLSHADWEAVCNLVIEGLRKNDGARGLARGIAKSGELLAAHFPIRANDHNELRNHLQLID